MTQQTYVRTMKGKKIFFVPSIQQYKLEYSIGNVLQIFAVLKYVENTVSSHVHIVQCTHHTITHTGMH